MAPASGKPASLARWQRETLAPFATIALAVTDAIRERSDNELAALRLAAEACSETNCAWSEHAAARMILPEILREQIARARDRLPKIAVTA